MCHASRIFGADLTVFTLYEDVVHLTRMIWGYYVNDRLGSEGGKTTLNVFPSEAKRAKIKNRSMFISRLGIMLFLAFLNI